MARTKQHRRNVGFRGYGKVFNFGFGTKWGSDQHESRSTRLKKDKRDRFRRQRDWNITNEDVSWLGDLVGAHPFHVAAQYEIPDDDLDVMSIDLTSDQTSEVIYGTLKGDIVGIQYYQGTVTNGEMVTLQREPHNRYDANAIRVLNMDSEQVGHIKRELAKPLAFIFDHKLARVEGIVPSGNTNVYKMQIDISLWGAPDKKNEALSVLRSHGFSPRDAAPPAVKSSLPGGSVMPGLDYSHVITNRVYLSPAEVRNELDKLFDTLEEGDKTTMTEPTQAIKTGLYPHQKQALNWMICKENNESLPPFWECRKGKYFNSLIVYTTSSKPKTVHAGILADDMGLGKTLEVISLILTNFRNGQPLAVPVPGRKRFGKPKLNTKKSVKNVDKKVENEDESDWDKYQQCLVSPEDSIENSDEEREQKAKYLKHFESKVPKFVFLPSGMDNSQFSEDVKSVTSVKSASCVQKQSNFSANKKIPDKETNLIINVQSEYFLKTSKSPEQDVVTISDESSVSSTDSVVRPDLQVVDCSVSKTNILENNAVPCDNAMSISDNVTRTPDEVLSKMNETSILNVKTSMLKKDTVTEIQVIDLSTEDSKDCPNYEDVIIIPDSSPVASSKKKISKSVKDEDFIPEKLSKSTSSPILSFTGRSRRNTRKPICYVDPNIDDSDTEKKPAKRARHNSLSVKLNTAEKPTPSTTNNLQCMTINPSIISTPQSAQVAIQQITAITVSTSSVQVPSTSSATPSLHVNTPSVQETATVKSMAPKMTRKGKSTSTKGNGKGKSKKKSTQDSFVDAPPLPSLPKFYDEDYTPSDDEDVIDSSDDWLPDLPVELPFKCTNTVVTNCDSTTGRTKSDEPRTTLIVCPLSVMNNWVRQLEEHVRDDVHLEIYTYYGTSRTTDSKLLEKQDIVITTYGTVSADSKGKSALKKVKWLRIILDEGHYIRNPKTLMTKSILELNAERRWVLTGTPIQNSLKDLYSLVNFLQINPLQDQVWWNRTIERPIALGEESAIKRVQCLMANIALRRTKTQQVNGKPIVELPQRNVYIETITLTDEERKVYTAMQNEGKLIISRFFQQGTLLHHYSQVMVILLRLRQLCCHPLLCSKAASGVRRAMELLGIDVENNNGDGGNNPPAIDDELKKKLIDALMAVLSSGSDEECAICLDSLKQPVITPCAHVYCRNCIETVLRTDHINPLCPLCRREVQEDKLIEVPAEKMQEPEEPIVTNKNWQSSSKVDALMKALVGQRSEDPSIKSVVVSQFTALLTLLEVPLELNGFKFARLDGTMTNNKRIRNIDTFMDPSPDSPTIFLLSLKAGGIGLNLTAACRVFLMDPAWNPAAEEQCFDRCHRLGQTKDVIVTKFLVEDSVEERMLALQDRKRELMKGAFRKKQTAEERRANRVNEIKILLDL